MKMGCQNSVGNAETRRERGDLIIISRIMKNMVVLNREYLIKCDMRDTRGHGRKIKNDSCRRNIKMNIISP